MEGSQEILLVLISKVVVDSYEKLCRVGIGKCLRQVGRKAWHSMYCVEPERDSCGVELAERLCGATKSLQEGLL